MKLKDVDLQRIWNIPARTLQNWKDKQEEDWRQKVYQELKYRQGKSEFWAVTRKDRHDYMFELQDNEDLIKDISYRCDCLKIALKAVSWDDVSHDNFEKIVVNKAFTAEDYIQLLSLQANCEIGIKLRQLEGID